MGLNCGASLIKYLLFIFNLICAVSEIYFYVLVNKKTSNIVTFKAHVASFKKRV